MSIESARHAPHVKPVPYVLRIGVTGHRALNDPAAVRAAVEKLVHHIDVTLRKSVEEPRSSAGAKRNLLDRCDRVLVKFVGFFWRTMPLTPAFVPRERQVPLEWRVISPLAIGADQIVADVITKDVHGKLDVVLPFPGDVVERDFETDEEKAAFRALLARDEDKIPFVAVDIENPSAEEKTEGYRLAGEHVVNASDILIGVWDGEEARGEGGTERIIAYATRKGVPVYWIDANNPSRPPAIISRNADRSGKRRPVPRTANEILPRYHQLCAYYRTPAYRESEYAAIYSRESKRLLADAEASERMRDAIQRRLPDYVYADQLATRHQALLLRSATLVIAFAALAVTVAAVHLLAFENAYWLILVEIGLMLTSAAMLRVSIRERWHEKWLNNRYLAERLRCLMFCEGLGQPPLEVNSIREFYPFYEGPAAWVDHVLESAQPYVPASENRDDPVALRTFLNKAWIGYQAGWHKTNVDKKKRSHKRLHWIGYSLFALTLVCAVLHWFHVGADHSAVHVPGLPEFIAILAVVLPAWGGAVHAVAHLRDHGRISAQSAQMHRQLQNLSEDLEHAESIEAIAAIAEKADKLMAVENSEWMMTLSYRKPELHV